MTLGAVALPLGALSGYLAAVYFFVAIAKLSSLLLPQFAMAGSLTHQGVGYLVKQYLLNLIPVSSGDKVFAKCDASLRVVAKTCSTDCSIKSKRVIN
jgi:hypothetical protein